MSSITLDEPPRFATVALVFRYARRHSDVVLSALKLQMRLTSAAYYVCTVCVYVCHSLFLFS
jgi:hypothetical protein